MRSVTHFLRYSSLKCSKQTFTVRSVIVNSFTSSAFPSEAIEETEKKTSLSCGRFHSLLVAFRNSKTRRHSEIKQTRPSTKQDFSEEAFRELKHEDFQGDAAVIWAVETGTRSIAHSIPKTADVVLPATTRVEWIGRRSESHEWLKRILTFLSFVLLPLPVDRFQSMLHLFFWIA